MSGAGKSTGRVQEQRRRERSPARAVSPEARVMIVKGSGVGVSGGCEGGWLGGWLGGKMPGRTANARSGNFGKPPSLAGVSPGARSEEHTSELQSRGLISYAVFSLKKK